MAEGQRQDRAQRQPESYLAGLDGIRGIAILMVLLWHTASQLRFPPGALGPIRGLVGMGWAGVDLFFALSGFLITSLLLREEQARGVFSLRRFYLRRALRILPPFALTYVLCFLVFGQMDVFRSVQFPRALGAASPWTPLAIAAFLTNYAFIYWEKVPPGAAIAVFWSLCVEEHFYLVWPATLRLLRSRRGRIAVALVLCLAALGLRFASRALQWESPTAVHMLSHYRIDSILWGAVAALLFDRAGGTRARRVALAAAWGATLLFIGKGWLSPQPTVVGHSLGLTFLAMAAALTVVETVAADTSRRWVRLLEWAPLRETGRISYEIYLLHLPAMDVGRALFLGERAIAPTLPAFLLAFAGSCALSFGFGWVAHRFVGRPALRLKSLIRAV